MALIRITQASEGIEDYLETGSKEGRELTRAQLDERVAIYGDLNCFRRTCEYSRKAKDWKSHYWHITSSFSYEDNQISEKKLTGIVDKMLAYYCCAYSINQEITAYAEAHYPKHQSIENKKNNQQVQRLLHIHLAISKVNRLTDLQLRLIPFNTIAEQAFQTHLNLKFNLTDPADRKRKKPVTQKDFFSRLKGDDSQKKTTVAYWREMLVELMSQVSCLDEAETLLLKQENMSTFRYRKNQRTGFYLQVGIDNADMPAINLRGEGFEALELLYKKQAQSIGYKVFEAQNGSQKYHASPEELVATFTQHMSWHQGDVNQRMSSVNYHDFSKTETHLKVNMRSSKKIRQKKHSM